MLNIVIPMAGRGSRFIKAGFTDPKPLIKINKKFMIEGVINNLKPLKKTNKHRFIFICQKDHIERYDLKTKLKEYSKNCIIIEIKEITEGAACTVLLAEELINNDDELMIANSDQWINILIDDYIEYQKRNKLDGLIMTMEDIDPKWSFIRFSKDRKKILEIVEKKVVSNEATVGIYNFRKGSFFCSSARNMIKKNQRVNGEFYVAPVYNEMIKNNKNIGIYNVGKLNEKMFGLGTPEDLKIFKSLKISRDF